LNRREKEQIISDLHQQIEKVKAVVLTNYRGLNVEQMNQLRQRLREEKFDEVGFEGDRFGEIKRLF
jgi:large subunit ribosomal protein L10